MGHNIVPIIKVDEKVEKKIDDYFATKSIKTRKLQEEYNELLMSVETKYPNESRHETALRYIRETESRSSEGNPWCKKPD